MPRLERVALAGLLLVLVVIAASVAIRLGTEGLALTVLRVAHRIASSGAALAVLPLGWLAWRERRARAPVAVAGALIAILATVGIVAGQAPSFASSMINILGGLALAATLAWLAGARAAHRPVLAGLVLLQCALGAWLSLTWRDTPLGLLLSHALLGLAVAAVAAILAMRLQNARQRVALLLLVLAVPAAGAAAALLDRALVPALAHACAAALLVASLTLMQSRRA
jgi:hypothetical protein